jgi:hypothetical protein
MRRPRRRCWRRWPEILVDLLNDPDERVAEAAAANPSLPRPVMEDLLAGRPPSLPSVE